MKAPVSGLSEGMSVPAIQRPLTCRNRSSWMRTDSSKAEKSIAGTGGASVTATMLPTGPDNRALSRAAGYSNVTFTGDLVTLPLIWTYSYTFCLNVPARPFWLPRARKENVIDAEACAMAGFW
jgi:hypothetical protein